MKVQLLFCSIFIYLITIAGFACKSNDPEPEKIYRFSETLTVDGRVRTYNLNLPPNYYEASNFSLVIAMHGGGGNANQFETTSRLTQKANDAKFIVVYPEGVKSTGPLGARTWNAGECCDYAAINNINDVKFISELINKLTNTYKIDPKKVYATGHSNGGMLAYRLACELSGKVAAIAPNGCTMVVKDACIPSRPVPVLHMHSVLDNHVPYIGGTGVLNAHYPPLDSVLNVWSINNSCGTSSKIIVDNAYYTFTKWVDCNSNSNINYYLTKDGGHAWPGGFPGSSNGDTPSTAINANDLLWEFFQQYQLP